jgi:ribosomal protein RSM22 (predicted rRNA methylase)
MGHMQLPADLRSAIESQLELIAPKQLAAAARALSQRYRASSGRAEVGAIASEQDVAAYLAYRLPATFAAVGTVFEEVSARLPGLQPGSLLDIGSGPGTAAWAALEVWPGLERITAVEIDPRMLEAGRSLAAHSGSAAIRDASWQRGDISSPRTYPAADIAVAAYVIGELPAKERSATVKRLWDASNVACVIVEPGTPRGSRLIRDATEQLDGAGAHILAPFPASWTCVETAEDWCHFAVRVSRTRAHRMAKGAALSYEDEKYAYVAAAREPGLPIAARVIRHPQVRPGHVQLVLCTAHGVRRVVVTRANREAFRRARDVRWGDAILPEEAGLFDIP